MPDTRSGIESGDERIDPNSDAGFSALLASSVAKQSGEEPDADAIADYLQNVKEGDRTVTSGLEESTQEGQPRDDLGRFSPAAQKPEVPEEGAAPQEESGEGESEESALAAFLERFQGDQGAALEAALKEKEEAQSLIGRQGSELGELRKAQQEAQELKERIARLEGRAEASPTESLPQAPQVSYEQLDEMIAGPNADGSGGPRAWAWAAQFGDPGLFDAILTSWKEYDPYAAAVTKVKYEQNLERLMSEREGQSVAETQKPDPLLSELRAERQIGSAVESVRTSMDEKDWAMIKPHIVPTLTAETTPDIVKNAVSSEDPDTQEQGIRALVELAKGRVVAEALAKNAQREANGTKKKETALATGSQSPTTARKPTGEDVSKMSKEERHALFIKQILETATTDVAAGLTYGPAQ